MLRKSLKFMAVIITVLIGWGLWVQISIRLDEKERAITAATEDALIIHKEAIDKAVNKECERDGTKLIEYHFNGEYVITNTYPYEIVTDVYIYESTKPEKETANSVNIIKVRTYFGEHGVYSSHLDTYIE